MDSQLVLNKFLGSWTSSVNVKSPEGEVSYSSVARFEWVLGGQFLQDVGHSPDSDNQHIGYWIYDAQAKLYRSWYFLHPVGAVMQFAHQWDEATQSLTGRADVGNGIVLNTTDHFYGDDRYDWTAVMVNQQGEVLSDMKGSCQRDGVDPES